MRRHFYQIRNDQISYLHIGNGSKLLLAIHGFNRSAEDFMFLQDIAEGKYTIISVDLFYHGKSSAFAHQQGPLSFQEWMDFINFLLKKYNQEKCSIIAYSLGGRIALKTVELMPEKIEKLVLLAPDGIQMSKLYQFASATRAGRGLYKYFIERPDKVMKVANTLVKYNIVPAKLAEFASYHVSSGTKREMVLNVWLSYQLFQSKLRKIANTINHYNIDTHILIGRYDHVIQVKFMLPFVKLLKQKDTLILLHTGHRLFNAQLEKELKKIL